jgi:hypothetical protein
VDRHLEQLRLAEVELDKHIAQGGWDDRNSASDPECILHGGFDAFAGFRKNLLGCIFGGCKRLISPMGVNLLERVAPRRSVGTDEIVATKKTATLRSSAHPPLAIRS